MTKALPPISAPSIDFNTLNDALAKGADAAEAVKKAADKVAPPPPAKAAKTETKTQDKAKA